MKTKRLKRFAAAFIAFVVSGVFVLPAAACASRSDDTLPPQASTPVDPPEPPGNEHTGNETPGNEHTGNETPGNEHTGNENTGGENTGNENSENGDDTGNDNNSDENSNNDNNDNNSNDNNDNNDNENNDNNNNDNDNNDNNNNGDNGDNNVEEPEPEPVTVSYEFTGADASSKGYAEGEITVSSRDGGSYKLYWADNNGALAGYYEIATLSVAAGASAEYRFGYHTAIPAGATSVIAVQGEVTKASYALPAGKVVPAADKLYSFSSYSDIHIDCDKEPYYKASAQTWAGALSYSVSKNVDFIVTSGDTVTNAIGPGAEWKKYQEVLAASDYVNPIWESDGNHDMRTDVNIGKYSFARATGTADGAEAANMTSRRPYYCVTEQTTGDLFIFMALEAGYKAAQEDEFSSAQLSWAEALVEQNYNTGKNIYIVQHSPIHGFGAGDRMSAPYYGGLLRENYPSTLRFKQLVTDYPKLIWMSGHTHEDFAVGYNYSDENGTACHMIHNPSVAGTTMPDAADTGLDYNNGAGFGSQGYYVEAYSDRVIFYGASLVDALIYPAYCYVMEGGRTAAPQNAASLPTPATNGTLSGYTMEGALAHVAKKLGDYYSFASYDKYQQLKKLYYAYRGGEGGDTAKAQLGGALSALETLVNSIGTDAHYFENSLGWGDVFCYAWGRSGKNAPWPGLRMKKVGRNGYDTNDVYGILFDNCWEYDFVIFNNGTDKQTVDIPLRDYKYNCVYPNSEKYYDAYKVSEYNYSYTGTLYRESERFAVNYYNGSAHAWDVYDTFFVRTGAGTYEYEFNAANASSVSIKVYDRLTGKAYCVATSAPFDYASGQSHTVTLSSSGQKSVTINGLSQGLRFTLVFDPGTKKLTVRF